MTLGDTLPAPSASRWTPLKLIAGLCFAWLYLLVGVVGILYTPYAIWHTRQFIAQAVRTNAPVVDFEKISPDRHQTRTRYRAIVEIVADGRPVRVVVGAPDDPPPYAIGQHLGVLYTPGDPSSAVLNDPSNLYFTTWLTFAIGLVFLSCGWFMLVRVGRPRDAPPSRLAHSLPWIASVASILEVFS